MLSLTGYEIQKKIYSGGKSVVYRGVKLANNEPVIIKSSAQEYPAPEDLARLAHEFEILKHLKLDGVVHTLALEKRGSQIALVREDMGGQSLKQCLEAQGRFALLPFLEIAVQLVETLVGLHSKGIMHKDIKPANIIFNSETGQVKLTDFGLASRLSRENVNHERSGRFEGTLAYISPEQTGRMNRSVDYRSDFYSLGVCFYEMLTGRLPFTATNPLELVHSHIAREPLPPHVQDECIPHTLSVIILKLLAKTAELRYQSAHGLQHDLERCLNSLNGAGEIEKFTLGLKDITGLFQTPEKLYGREEESAKILATFERICAGAANEMLLVSGYSGIGKTALVTEVHKPLVREKGYFISGKFDQFKRNIPFSSLIQAFQELVRQLLTESDERIVHWKEKLEAALGTNGGIITEVIPEVELIIGIQAPVPELPPTETRNRFNAVFQNFVRIFADRNHPLIVFLDDLQWADTPSLELIQTLVSDPNMTHFFLMGAFRDNEVDPSHPLMFALEEIRKTGAHIIELKLEPLDNKNVNHLIRDTVYCNEEQAAPLTELVKEKTNGNPFFVIQFLKTLGDEDLLRFDTETARWIWDLDQIRRASITDNVVDLMAGNIRKLNDETQKILQLAACIGARFSFDILSVVNQDTAYYTASQLWPALKAGLVVPLNESYQIVHDLTEEEFLKSDRLFVPYKFLHDRVQEAAYSLIIPEERAALHVKIGRLIHQDTSPDELEDRLFEIVNHLNAGLEIINNSDDRLDLAQLNLDAGRKAKASTAYQPALKYLSVALELLPENPWQDHYELSYHIHFESGECEYLLGKFDAAEKYHEILLANARTKLDRVRVYRIKLILYDKKGQYDEAIRFAREGLKLFNITFPEKYKGERVLVLRELKVTNQLLGDREIMSIVDSPEMTDPEKLASVDLLMNMSNVTYARDRELNFLVGIKMVNLSLEYGLSTYSAHSYTFYGALLCGMGALEPGHQFGELGVALTRQRPHPATTGKVTATFGWFINHWRKHARTSLPLFKQGYQKSLEAGDYTYLYLNASEYLNTRFHIGDSLEAIQKEAEQFMVTLNKIKYKEANIICKSLLRTILAMCGGTETTWTGGDNEAISDREEMELQFPTALGHYQVCKLQEHFLLYDFEAARRITEATRENLESLEGIFRLVEFFFYDSLLAAEFCSAVTGDERPMLIEQIQKNLKKLKKWADSSPENYGHRYLLVRAELERLEGYTIEALASYDEALHAARDGEFVQNEALINELTCRFFQNIGNTRVARMYLLDARWDFQKWGATVKVQRLDDRYSELLSGTHSSERRRNGGAETSSSNDSAMLDLASVMKASRTISGEIKLGELLQKIMQIIIENAGARRGYLMLRQEDGTLAIEAEGEISREEVNVLGSIGLDSDYARERIARMVVNYTARMRTDVVLSDAAREGMFVSDEYVVKNDPRSILCSPIIHQNELVGMIYLENNLTIDAFTPQRIEILKVLSSQAAVSIQNARLYANLENKVAERTAELHRASEESKLLADLSRKATESADLDTVLSSLVDILNERFGIDRGLLAVISEDKTHLLARSAIKYGTLFSVKDIPEGVQKYPLKLGAGTRTYQKKRSVVGDATASRRKLMTDIDREIVDFFDIERFCMIPLILHEEVVGVISLAGPSGFYIKRKDLPFCERLVDQLAGTIRASELLHQTSVARTESDRLLTNILPPKVADELKKKGAVEPLFYDAVSVLFTDFVGFTKISERLLPHELVEELDGCFGYFDSVVRRNGLEKLKTIGDAYMCCAGLPEISQSHPVDACLTAIEFREFMKTMGKVKGELGLPYWELRIGIHSGPVTAGVIGTEKFAYDIWGDTVNTASRMESSGEAGKINISAATFELIKDIFECTYRGKIDAKGKGELDMYFVDCIKPEFSSDDVGLIPNDKLLRIRERMRVSGNS